MKARGYDFKEPKVRDSHYRRAQKFANDAMTCLKAIGVHEDDIEIEIERNAARRAPAVVEWWFEGHNLHYSYNKLNHAENMAVVAKVLEHAVIEFLQEQISLDDFLRKFREDDVHKERAWAREALGVEHDNKDFKEISKKYKSLSKAAHPDMPTGDHERFQELNKAHKILKRELE